MEKERGMTKRTYLKLLGGGAIAATAGAAGYWAYTQYKPEEGPTPQELKLGWAMDMYNLDTFVAVFSNSIVQSNIFETMLVPDPQMRLLPALATSYEDVDSYHTRFHLREGVKFHCGLDFDANVVEEHWAEQLHPEHPGYAAGAIKQLKQVHREDDYTVVMESKVPYGYMSLDMATVTSVVQCPVCRKEYGEEYGVKYPCGTGPFKFVRWLPNEFVELERYEDYWRGPVKLEKLIWKVIPEDSTRIIAYERGEIHQYETASTPLGVIDQYKGAPEKHTVYITPSLRTIMWWMNTILPPTDDVRVRKAIAHAIDRATIGEAILGDLATLANGFCAPGYEGFHAVEIPEYDPNKAKQLLLEAGFELGSGGIMERDGEPLRLVCLQVEKRDYRDAEIAEAAVAQCKEAGIDVDLQLMSAADQSVHRKQYRDNPDWNIYGGGMSAPNGAIYWALHHNYTPQIEQGFNPTYLGSPEFDALFEEAIALPPEESAPIWAEAQELLAELMPSVPFFYVTTADVMKSYVKDFQPHPLGGFAFRHFDKVYIEK